MILSDEKELIKKVTNLLADTKKHRIIDFDTGLLHEGFEDISGKPSEKYDKLCKKLSNIGSN